MFASRLFQAPLVRIFRRRETCLHVLYCTVSICAICTICFLFFSELSVYLTTVTEDHLAVDVSRGEKLRINFGVSITVLANAVLWELKISRRRNLPDGAVQRVVA